MVDKFLAFLPLQDYDVKWDSLDVAKDVLTIAAGNQLRYASVLQKFSAFQTCTDS